MFNFILKIFFGNFAKCFWSVVLCIINIIFCVVLHNIYTAEASLSSALSLIILNPIFYCFFGCGIFYSIILSFKGLINKNYLFFVGAITLILNVGVIICNIYWR